MPVLEHIDLIYSVLFYVFAGLAIGSAITMVTFNNPIYSTLSLILTFISVSGLYVLLNAQVLAMINIIVYAGAIMVLFIFVIMLINVKQDNMLLKIAQYKQAFYVGTLSVIGILLSCVFVYSMVELNHYNTDVLAQTEVGLMKTLGTTLFTTYIFPFELTGILFMVALIGGVMFGKK